MNIIIEVILSFFTVIVTSAFGQQQSNETAGIANETIIAGMYGNYTRFEYANELNGRMADHLTQLNLFSEVCSDYTRLQVQEETDKCIMVLGDFNRQLVDFKDRYDVMDKNIAIGAKSLDIPPDQLPLSTEYCSSYEVYAGMTDEQCQKAE